MAGSHPSDSVTLPRSAPLGMDPLPTASLFDMAVLTPDLLPYADASRLENAKRIPFAMRMALRIMQRLEWGTLIVSLPTGETLRFAGRQQPDAVAGIRIHDMAMASRLMTAGNVGVAEAYLDGQWDSPDLTALLDLVSRNGIHFRTFIDARPLTRLAQRFAHSLNRNTKRQSRKNIEAHYDLGNAFYETWLDRTMTYSSARFDHPAQDLALAQETKYTRLAELLDIRSDHHLLEIGCGWGGFALHVAKTTGARVTGITLSQAQYDYARQRIFNEGLGERISIELRDYRDVDGHYDRIASIEMFEAVGERYWPYFFSKLKALLKPNGRAGLQIITIRDDLYQDYRTSQDFIQRYVFPGGMLPSPEKLRTQIALAKLMLTREHTFGADYARTLAQWRRRFLDAWPRIAAQGFDERFKRIWLYYLCYCEAGFRSGATDVGHYLMASEP